MVSDLVLRVLCLYMCVCLCMCFLFLILCLFALFSYDLFVFIGLLVFWGERESVELDGWGGGEDLRRDQGGKM